MILLANNGCAQQLDTSMLKNNTPKPDGTTI